LGLEGAGFEHIALVEIEPVACETLKANRPFWNVLQGDVRNFSAKHYKGKIDLLAGGVPCPPFSVAGKQLGQMDDRDLFPEAIRLI
jgi:DNA (cytosine-5)-methyltransferase 1